MMKKYVFYIVLQFLLIQSFNHNTYIIYYVLRTSTPLVKVNLTYMKHKSDRVNLVTLASPADFLLY